MIHPSLALFGWTPPKDVRPASRFADRDIRIISRQFNFRLGLSEFAFQIMERFCFLSYLGFDLSHELML